VTEQYRPPPAVLRFVLISQRRRLAISCLLLMGHQACEALVPVVLGAGIDQAVKPGDGDALIKWLVILVALFVVLSLAYRFGARFGQRAALEGEHDLRLLIAGRVLEGGGGNGRPPGVLLGLAVGDAAAGARVMQALAMGLAACTAIVLGGVLLFLISPWLGLLVLIGLPVLVVAAERLGRPLATRAAHEQERAARAATDLVRGLRVVKGLRAEEAATAAYRVTSEQALHATLRSAAAEAVAENAARIINGAFLAVVALVAGRLAVDHEISIGDLIAAVGLTQFLIGPLSLLGWVGAGQARARASLTRIDTLLTEPIEAAAPDAGAVALAEAARERGGVTAVVAADPADAHALLDALAVVDGALVVPHESDLFEGTLRANVAAARGAEAEVEPALAAAAADEVAATLPDGADSWIGERGRTLSGGQRQRVALARALAADAQLLVLHEPTTAIDAATEARVAGGLREARAGRETVIVTSSPALLAVADRVLIVEGGALRAAGTHGELLQSDSLYRELVAA
jgi:putative ABC transport system ATP-binding protein